jgi:hypothetical protein
LVGCHDYQRNINHWWPYWFINPDEHGVPSMLMYIVGITLILILTAMLLVFIRNLFPKKKALAS